ncbi:MAG: HD domain-containing protein [Clostridiaceae bacterium]
MIEEVMISMMKYFSGDVKRINHAMKVFCFAQTICEKENIKSNEKEIVKLSSILHDIGIKEAERKYNSSAGKYQEIEGPFIAEEILNRFKLDIDTISRVKFIIGNHHSYNKIDDIDFQILVEADFLVNIYEDNIEKETVKIIKDKYFKTNTGREIIDSIYL